MKPDTVNNANKKRRLPEKILYILNKSDEDISEEEEIIVKKPKDPIYVELKEKINDINDLIRLGKMYDASKNIIYNVDLEKLNKIVEPLEDLRNMIGLGSVKRNIVGHITYYLQKLEDNQDMMHTVIQGPPGVGKTMLGRILGKIYFGLGILKPPKYEKPRFKMSLPPILRNDLDSNVSNDLSSNDKSSNDKLSNDKSFKNKLREIRFKRNRPDSEIEKPKDGLIFKIVKRSDLIGKYLGHTAMKTQKVIDSCRGGVLFIDEAYSLGNPEGKDSFSKECIDTINQNLTENKANFLCIIAGYRDALEKCFFSYNEGLRRRFTFRYTIEKYTPDELREIFIKMIKDINWVVKEDNIPLKFFVDNYDSFENLAGDMETLLFNCKIEHGKRVFCLPKERKILTYDDIKTGFSVFLENRGISNSKYDANEIWKSLYV